MIRRSGRRVRWLAPALALVIVGVVLAGTVLAGFGPSDRRSNRSAHSSAGRRAARAHTAAADQVTAERDRELNTVAQAFSTAMREHDPAGVQAAIDPRARAFAAALSQWVADARAVPLSTWRLRLGPVQGAADARRVTAAGSEVVYRIAGFDHRLVHQPVTPTLVRAANGWRIAALTTRHDGLPAATEVWDFGPVRAVRAPGVIAFGPPRQLATVRDVAILASRQIPRVTAVWGDHWPRRAVIELPASQHQLAVISGYPGPMGAIAAVTDSEINNFGRADPSGNRVAINPRVWRTLTSLGRQVVIVHELTHLATRAVTGARAPRWLTEGFAEWVSYHGTGVSTTEAASDLRHILAGTAPPTALPSNAQFTGTERQIDAAYDEALVACSVIADHWGSRTLVRFYRSVGGSGQAPVPAVRAGLRRVLRIGPHGFLRRWRARLAADFG